MADNKFNCEIKINDGAFVAGSDYATIPDPTPMTNDLSHALSIAENLERYDDFSWLKIDPVHYRKEDPDSPYGIAYNAAMHGSDGFGGDLPPIILDNQKAAALRFLRDLRGFGLLADMVGSGKTFEAGVVLSELVARGLIESLLIIVPNDNDENSSKRTSVVMEQWIDVIERRFGLGVDSLAIVETPDDVRKVGTRTVGTFGGKTYYTPVKPIIVTHDNFDKWKSDDKLYSSLVFHLVMVDEIHRFYLQKDEYPNAMYVLSCLMRNKKAANCPYCVLLSATPHSGNLESMFDLWYFIRFKGGNPACFLPSGKKDREYTDAKTEYIDRFCRGATTVAEYISESQSIKLANRMNRDAALKSAYNGFLKRSGLAPNEYETMTRSEHHKLEEEFLHDHAPLVQNEIQKSIAGDYHNGLMRKIMIRQRNHMHAKRRVENYYFYPMRGIPSDPTLRLMFEGRELWINTADLMGDTVTYRDYDGAVKHTTLYEICRIICRERGAESADGCYSSLVSHIMMALANRSDGFDPVVFRKEKSKIFYGELFSRVRSYEDEHDHFLVLPNYKALSSETIATKRLNCAEIERYENAANKDAVLSMKLELTRKILREHPNERVLVFFDYELKPGDAGYRQWEDVYKALLPEFGAYTKPKTKTAAPTGRLICGYRDAQRNDDIAKFNAADNGVLIAWNKNFTESLNLQMCTIIINFCVTPDPLAMDQRIGRIYRLGQTQDITIHSFAEMNRLDGYSLAYFNSIGLMYNCNGDATIIAGSNNEGMSAIQCLACNRVEMFTEEEVEAFRRRLKTGEVPEALKCRASEECRLNDNHYTIMTPINTEEFICDKCKLEIRRGEDGYICPKSTDGQESGKLVNYFDRTYGCSKFCVIRNCDEFKRDRRADPEFKKLFGAKAKSLSDVCGVFRALADGSVSGGELNFAKFKLICAMCPAREHHICPDKCGFLFENNHVATEQCRTCGNAPCRPFKYVFDDNWVATCPSCHERKLHRKAAHTFAAYIRAAYNFNDNGKSFCTNFLKETRKVETIKRILEQDEEDENA